MIIIAAGVISFWIIAFLLLLGVCFSGAIEAVDDSQTVANAQVQIVAVSPNSPAATAGLQMSDIIKKISLATDPSQSIEVDKSRPSARIF